MANPGNTTSGSHPSGYPYIIQADQLHEPSSGSLVMELKSFIARDKAGR